MIQFAIGALTAVVLGVTVDLLTGATTKGLRTMGRRFSPKRLVRYDGRADGLYMIGEWSPRRRLSPDRLITTFLEEAPVVVHGFVDPSDWAAAVQDARHDTGDLAFMTAFRLDHRESESTQQCHVSLAPSDYSSVRAIESLRKTWPGRLRRADDALATNSRKYLESAVPSSFAINIIPIRHGEMLCAQRSAAVDNGIGLWTVGIFEALKRTEPNNPGRQEDFYALAERALEEELGLRGPDYGAIDLTWIGIYQPLLRGHLVAVVPVRISKEDVAERAIRSDSSYEHFNFSWLPLTKRVVNEFLDAHRLASDAEVADALWVDKKRWIDQAQLSVTEAWRFRSVIDQPQ